MPNQFSRRLAIKNIVAGTAALSTSGILSAGACASEQKKQFALKGNINHSVCQWIYDDMTLDQLCKAVKGIGMDSIDLLAPKDWPVLQKNGIYCSMCYTVDNLGLYKGWNNKEYHPHLIKDYTDSISLVAKAGYKNLICFSGARNGMDDWTGLDNCVEGLKKILPVAERNGVIIVMELLNSKIDHKDYMCDKTLWGVELCKRIGSPNFKLLYDIYHMQIDEGDVIRTIQNYHEYIGHYHTGGVPGRNEIDDTQELYYPAIMRAIVTTGYKGHVAQEFIPKNPDKIAALKKCVEICDV
ncbi:MAG: TIM barrel protein [Bacteroidetes bacterium]|nr:TIM barrel protein [Bacteroidota bacterium]